MVWESIPHNSTSDPLGEPSTHTHLPTFEGLHGLRQHLGLSLLQLTARTLKMDEH